VSRDNATIYFYGDVSKASTLKLFQLLPEAAVCAGGGEVWIYIHSDGGCAYAGLSALDHLLNFDQATVVCVADGFMASAATLLYLGGHRRLAFPRAQVLLHQLSAVFSGKYSELRDEMKNSTTLMRTLESIYEEYTTMKSEKIRSLLADEVTLTAQEARQLGIAHEIIGR
jgi:ATP-dependent Clp protease protease subunit